MPLHGRRQRRDEYTAKTSAASIKVKDTSNFMINFTIGYAAAEYRGFGIASAYLIHAEIQQRITMGALIAA